MESLSNSAAVVATVTRQRELEESRGGLVTDPGSPSHDRGREHDSAIMSHSMSSERLEIQARKASESADTDKLSQSQRLRFKSIKELKSGSLRTLANALLDQFARKNTTAEELDSVKYYLLAHGWVFKTSLLIEQITRPIWESAMLPVGATNVQSVPPSFDEGSHTLSSGSTGSEIVFSIGSSNGLLDSIEGALGINIGTEGGGQGRSASVDEGNGGDDDVVIIADENPARADPTDVLSPEDASIKLMCYWKELAPYHFDGEDEQVILDRLCELSLDFMTAFNAVDKKVTAAQALSHQENGHKGSQDQAPSIALHQMTERQLAEHIAHLDFMIFSTIPDSELFLYAKKARSTLTTTPQLQRAIEFFNGCSQYMTSMVLQGHNSVTRAKAFSRFIHVAKELRKLRCYNAVMAAVGALKYGSSVTRLSQTLELIPKQDLQDLEELSNLLSVSGNYTLLRKEISSMPDAYTSSVIGIVMKDLIAVDSAMPNKVGEDPNRVFNFAKVLHFGLLADQVHKFQSIPPKLAVDEELLKILQVSFQPLYTEKELYELSLDREPRTSKEPKEPSPLIPFQVWTQSNSVQVDRATMDSYIESMVDSVFKRYDMDKSGSISMEEFESIKSNFVFLENFQELDANQDGVISRAEMLAYFKKVNFMRALRESFVHDFQEITFFSPAYCAHCKGLLWGLVKQGLKCKSCNSICHRHCQDRIVIDCHRVATATLNKKPAIASAKRPALQTRRSTIAVVANLEGEISSGKVTKEEIATRVHDLMVENEQLQKKVHELQRRLDQRESQMSLVRQRTIAFVLEHLDNLNSSRESSL